MLCDRDQSEKLFLFDTDHHRVTLSECVYGSPVCATVYSMAYPGHHLHYNPTYVSPYLVPFAAVVMFGKGLVR